MFVVLRLALVIMAIAQPAAPAETGRVDVLATSDDECVVCHRRTTPGIVEQYGHSTIGTS
jgi:hypothetical protein